MKRHIAGLFSFALLLAAASAHAQITQTVRFHVPFPFVAAGQNLPAADYSVKITHDTGLILLSSSNRSVNVLSIRQMHPGREDFESVLRFKHYGNRWVLEDVNQDGIDQVLRKSKVEEKLARLTADDEQTLMASNISSH